jgi:2'-5' RNA ligase
MDGAFVADLPPPPGALRLFHPADVHLTLSFLGGCGEERALAALGALDAALAAEPLEPIDVTLGEVVPMGSRRRYTALSALLERGRPEAVAALARLRDGLADAAAVTRDTREPKPHVTLARPRGRASDADRAAGLAWAAGLQLSGVSARLERIALYTWGERRLTQLFQIVAERRLPGASEPAR